MSLKRRLIELLEEAPSTGVEASVALSHDYYSVAAMLSRLRREGSISISGVIQWRKGRPATVYCLNESRRCS